MATRWLDDAEQNAWRTLVSSTNALMATLDSELQRAHGLSLGDYEVLVRLSEAPGHTLRMTELAHAMHLSPSGMTRRIDGLVKAGLVERRQCPTDRRGQNAVLTKEGVKQLKTAAPTHVAGVREHFIDRLDARQLATVAAAMEKVTVDPYATSPACDER